VGEGDYEVFGWEEGVSFLVSFLLFGLPVVVYGRKKKGAMLTLE